MFVDILIEGGYKWSDETKAVYISATLLWAYLR